MCVFFCAPFLRFPTILRDEGIGRGGKNSTKKKKKEKDACSSIGSEYFGMSEKEEVDGRKGGWIPEEKSGAIRKLV